MSARRRAEEAGGARGARDRDRPRSADALPASLHRPHRAEVDPRPADRRRGDGAGHGQAGAVARRTRNGRSLVEIDVFDGSSYLVCTFFNQPWRAKQLAAGTEAVFFGKLDVVPGQAADGQPGRRPHRRQDRQGRAGVPAVREGGADHVGARRLRHRGAANAPASSPTRCPKTIRDELDLVGPHLGDAQHPRARVDGRGAWRRASAWPSTSCCACRPCSSPASAATKPRPRGSATSSAPSSCANFHASLPFPLTGAQQRVIAEIDEFLAGPHPMHLLLQGDVGSGKTVVAVTALLTAVAGGYQGALMAPTEVLAEQHALGVRALLAGVTVASQGGTLVRRAPAARRTAHGPGHRHRTQADRAPGSPTARSTSSSAPTRSSPRASRSTSSACAVIDEQHRFGVEQRAALRGKGDDPDVLVMTATPIPAHRGDDRLRRPRRRRARRAAARAHADRHHVGARANSKSRRRGRRCATRSRPGARPTSCVR